MPRLIDADAYAAEMHQKQEDCRAWKDSLDRGSETYARAEQSFITFIEAALTLKKQPTVDAIPMWWITEKFLDVLNKDKELSKAVWLVRKAWQKEQGAR